MSNIRDVDLNLLKALDALLDERSVTRAAARLGLTQPGVSGMLMRLRDAFGDPLFVRAQRGMIPTPRALDLAVPLKTVLREVDTLFQPAIFDPLTTEMTFTIAATDYAQKAVIVPFLASLARAAPGMRVAVRSVDYARLSGRFERGELDLALLTPEATPQDLHSRRLFDEDYVCVLRAGHPDATGDRMSLDGFCALGHALMSHAGDVFRGVTDDALARRGRTRRVVASIPSFLVLLDVVRSSDLVAVVPRRLVRGAEGLVVLAPPVEVPGFEKVAAWHERTHKDPAHRWVRALMFEACRNEL